MTIARSHENQIANDSGGRRLGRELDLPSNAELATDVAKDFVWEERFNVLTGDQLLIYAKQHRRLDRLRDKVDVIITDCHLLMCIPYIPKGSYKGIEPLIVESASTFDNMNFFLGRAEGTHTDDGRYHDHKESLIKDQEIRDILDKYDPTYTVVPVDRYTVETIFACICNREVV